MDKISKNSFKRLCNRLNMELTIKEFFKSVQSYIGTNLVLYTKENDLNAIKAQRDIIKSQEKQIMEMIEIRKKVFDAYKINKMAWEVRTVECPGYQAFIKPNSVDNSALVAYRDVINGITEYIYYNDRPDAFLAPLKNWYYTISKRKLKDFVYPFIPLKHFIVKGTQR